MFSLYCWETNTWAGTELVGTRISLFWLRTQVSQWPLRPSLNSLCSFLPSPIVVPPQWPFCLLTTKLPFLRTFACAVTSTLNIFPWLGLVPFQFSFLLLHVSFSEKPFLIVCVGYFLIVPQKHLLPLSTLFCSERHLQASMPPLASSWIRRSEGRARSGDFFLGSLSDDSHGWVVCLYWKLLPRGCFLQPQTPSPHCPLRWWRQSAMDSFTIHHKEVPHSLLVSLNPTHIF